MTFPLRTPVLALTITLLVALPVPGEAQERSWVPRPSPLHSLEEPSADPFAPPVPADLFPADSIPETQWKKGALIGAAIGLTLGVMAGRMGCGNSTSCTDPVLMGVGGALVFAIPGALIAGSFPKEHEPGE